MTTSSYPSISMSVEEYLRFEEASPERHEYVAGQVYAMSGVTVRHSQICMNLSAILHGAVGDGPCQAIALDVKLQTAHDKIYYPDVMVVCDAYAPETRVVRDPCLVIEVTSPSTRRVDRSEKLVAYQAIESLQTYLVVEQGARLVEHHWRDSEGTWQYAALSEPGAAITLAGPPLTLSLDAIYRRVVFDAPGRPRRVREVDQSSTDDADV